jgi:hypothetical protein
MILNSTDTLELVTSAAVDTDVTVWFHDEGPNPSPLRSQVTAITTDDTTAICNSPGAGTARIVDGVSIRNKDAATCTYTPLLNGSATVELYEATILAGGHLNWLPGTGWTTSSASTLGVTNTVVLQEDVANSADATYANVTGLSFAVEADLTYSFRFVIPYTAAAGTTGSAWAVSGPASPTAIYVRSSYPSAATTETYNAVDDYDLPAAGNGDTPAGATAIIEGVIEPSAAGTVIARFLSDVNTSAITAKAGAYVEWKRVL